MEILKQRCWFEKKIYSTQVANRTVSTDGFTPREVVAKLWPEKTDTHGYVGPINCNETGTAQNPRWLQRVKLLLIGKTVG
jgi:hypothetical protein